MSVKQHKSHKAMSDVEWDLRLKKFASTGIWPSNYGNRPAPRQKKWYEIYQRVSECLLHLHEKIKKTQVFVDLHNRTLFVSLFNVFA